MPQNIVITGASGFIGSHITEKLLSLGHKVIALKRSHSDLWRCKDFEAQVAWVNTDSSNWKKDILGFSPDIIIHAAWNGIDAGERQVWKTQFSNIDFLLDLLDIAAEGKVQQFISLGSQAEYGNLNNRIDEKAEPKPDSPYGIAKLTARRIVQVFCEKHNIKWYWPIIFSVFGPKEDKKWFIPMLINNFLHNKDCDLSLCEQKYDYIYIKDFVEMLVKIHDTQGKSGVYHVSSNSAIPLKEVVETIHGLIKPASKINFGTLPYREGQSMHIEGDSSLFINTFGNTTQTQITEALQTTIDYYKKAF